MCVIRLRAARDRIHRSKLHSCVSEFFEFLTLRGCLQHDQGRLEFGQLRDVALYRVNSAQLATDQSLLVRLFCCLLFRIDVPVQVKGTDVLAELQAQSASLTQLACEEFDLIQRFCLMQAVCCVARLSTAESSLTTVTGRLSTAESELADARTKLGNLMNSALLLQHFSW